MFTDELIAEPRGDLGLGAELLRMRGLNVAIAKLELSARRQTGPGRQ